MSDFLNSLNKNAKTEGEYTHSIKQEEDERRQQFLDEQQKRTNLLKNQFENLLTRFIPEIQQLCSEAVSKACYITYNGKRYLICSIALREYYDYDEYYSGNERNCWLQFNCYKLKKNHILESKRQYQEIYVTKGIDYVNGGQHVDPSAIGCNKSTSTFYSPPSYINFKASLCTKLDGYTNITTLPTRITNINYPPEKDHGTFHYRRTIIEHRFLIEF